MQKKKSEAWKCYSLISILVITSRITQLTATLKTSKNLVLRFRDLSVVGFTWLLLSLTTRNSVLLTWNKPQNKSVLVIQATWQSNSIIHIMTEPLICFYVLHSKWTTVKTTIWQKPHTSVLSLWHQLHSINLMMRTSVPSNLPQIP